MNTLFDLVLAPLAMFSDRIGLLIAAIVFGVLFVPIYGKVSPQRSIARAKKKIFAALIESVVFRRNSTLSLRAQGKMFWSGLIYFFLAVPPILILAIPGIILLAQCNLYFGYSGITPGHSTVLLAQFEKSSDLRTVALHSSDDVLTVSPPVRDRTSGEVWWRVDVGGGSEAQRAEVFVSNGVDQYPVTIAIGKQKEKIYPMTSSSFWHDFFYPSKLVLPAWLTNLAITYPEKIYHYLGIETGWLLVFLVVSIISGYCASKVFGVEV